MANACSLSFPQDRSAMFARSPRPRDLQPRDPVVDRSRLLRCEFIKQRLLIRADDIPCDRERCAARLERIEEKCRRL